MIKDFKGIKGLFKDINKVIPKKVNFYIIGGTALLYQGMKPATKDIDIVVETKKEFIEIEKALKKLDFKLQTQGKEYTHMNLSQIFQKKDFRLDIFEKKVCGKFSLSKTMMKRAEKIINFNNIKVYICSNEDIFLFKTMTEREGDLAYCISIATTTDPDWSIMLEELKYQINHNKKDVWITWIGERLDILEEKGLIIPITKEINKLREKYYHELEKKQNKHKS